MNNYYPKSMINLFTACLSIKEQQDNIPYPRDDEEQINIVAPSVITAEKHDIFQEENEEEDVDYLETESDREKAPINKHHKAILQKRKAIGNPPPKNYSQHNDEFNDADYDLLADPAPK
ncbi:hypothetical protein L1987_32507 [Smallanthus sonchifolius]|uniref:Uncharacterized protein n=1 Tax=Smallanthus sonchifolius TaxID=185202 RepID=A0ACB9HNQ3_9ASTR|nr:hypothetical protein L1987_32507 [Smallanthus sonchifolius]